MAETLHSGCSVVSLTVRRITLALAFVWLAAFSASSTAAASSSWSSYGFSSANTRANTGETVLNATSLGGVANGWVFSDPSSAYEEYSEPAVYHGVAYFGLRNGVVYAVALNTGRLLWSYQTGGSVLATPVIAGNTLYVGSFDGNCYALSLSTGALIWKYTTGGIVASPVLGDGRVYFSDTDGNMYAIDAQTGSLAWEHTATTPGHSYSDAVFSAGKVFYSAWTENGEPADVIALDAVSGQPIWSNLIYATWDPSSVSDPTVAGGMVYAWAMAGNANGNLAAFSAATGKRIWYDPGYWFGGDTAFAHGLLFEGYGYNNPAPCIPYRGGNCGYPEGSGIVAMSPRTGAPVWDDPGAQDTLTIAGNLVYGSFTSEGTTAFGAAEATDGRIVWRDPELDGMSGPTIAGGSILFPSGNAIWDYQHRLVNTESPIISGTTKVGDDLKATAGVWTGAVNKLSYSYAWEECAEAAATNCTAIPGATKASLKLLTADAGRYVTVVVTASNEDQGAHASAVAVGPVASG
ncbi:MAG TPA: PQQ-binding-like beta-propeller repeat protein [Solirubrobacteraceae bacterium]|jgi:outer membrane protein assembly factor BamB|nr:PQQ-binding-like beta-propeller repeat protein [Solirubrobacteraceae bacterium]